MEYLLIKCLTLITLCRNAVPTANNQEGECPTKNEKEI